MSAAGFLLLSSVALAAPPDGPAVGSPRLARGDELVYQGQITEAGERIGNRFRKHSELEVRVFVLETRPGSSDCAVLTLVRPVADPVIAGPAAAVTGADPARQVLPPAVSLELIRVDDRGRVVRLAPPPGPPPLPLSASTPTQPPLPLLLDLAPVCELGMFLPLPPRPARMGTSWETADPGRPPIIWSATREVIWNGGRCLEVQATQQTAGWDQPAAALRGWRRQETIQTAPVDGYASTVARRIERREGASVIGWVEVRYELQPPNRYAGRRYNDVRREIEAAWGYQSELEECVSRGKLGELPLRRRKIEELLADEPATTGFRPALEAVRRRYEAVARGETIPLRPALPAEKPAPPQPGRPAPDFVAPLVYSTAQFRLSAARGQPVVLVFFRPGTETAPGALAVAEALHRVYDGQLTVAALTVSSQFEAANQQRADQQLTVPLADGSGIRAAYAIESYPRFFVIDSSGLLTWDFTGYGPETGYLVKEQVEKLLKPGKGGNRPIDTTGRSGTTWETIRTRLRLPAVLRVTYDSIGVGPGAGEAP